MTTETTVKIESTVANEFLSANLESLSESDCFELAKVFSARGKALVSERHELEQKHNLSLIVKTLMTAHNISEADATAMVRSLGIPGAVTTDQPVTGTVYQNPKDSKEVWTGGSRGRKPQWLAEYLESGGKFTDLPTVDVTAETETTSKATPEQAKETQ